MAIRRRSLRVLGALLGLGFAVVLAGLLVRVDRFDILVAVWGAAVLLKVAAIALDQRRRASTPPIDAAVAAIRAEEAAEGSP